MRFSLPTRIIAVVAVVALAAVFAAPAQAAGAPGIARTGTFSWLSQSVWDWVSALFGVDLARPAAPAVPDSGLRRSPQATRAEITPDGAAASSSSTPTSGTTTLFVGGAS